jgi:hypothetical protein
MPDEEPFSSDSADYDAIEAAVVETERGRWFLKEYARRNRNADSLLILEALDHLNRLMKDRARSRAGTGRDDVPTPPGPGGAGLVLRDAAAALRDAIGRIRDRREALQVEARGDHSSNGTGGPEPLRTIDGILETLRGLEARMTALLAAGEPSGDIRAAEIARLKDEMMRDAMPSVPYLM